MNRQEMCQRHSGLLPYDKTKETRIEIIGAGAVGGWTALSLAKMGFDNITVWDTDTVGIENVGNQLFGPAHIGKPKVDALKHIVQALSGVVITTRNERYEGQVLSGIIIVAVDNMITRECVYLRSNSAVRMVIDPRMGAEMISVYQYDPNNSGRYSKSLHTDENAEHQPCTAKSTVYTASIVSGIVCKIVKDYIMKQRMIKSVFYDVLNSGFVANKEEVSNETIT